jgi:hypothetical protein
MTEQRLNLTTAVRHAKNQNVLILDAINYDVLANWKTSRANAKVVVTGAA